MSSLKELAAAKYRRDPDVLGVSAVENRAQLPSITDGFDLLLLIVTCSHERACHTHHYIKEQVRIQEKWVHAADLHPKSLDDNQNLMQWLIKGEILLDRGGFLEGMRHKMLEFPIELRENMLLSEFGRFLRFYLQSKEYLLEEHLLDAYNNILEALHVWARIVVLEAGQHPELAIWRQIRCVNPGVYKLYEELTTSSETLKQRVQLVLLACEFSVMSRMERCCRPLIALLASREQPWSFEELRTHPALQETAGELPLILNRLAKKLLIRELVFSSDSEFAELELRYTAIC